MGDGICAPLPTESFAVDHGGDTCHSLRGHGRQEASKLVDREIFPGRRETTGIRSEHN